MSEIVLFHSVLGVRPGVHAFADQLRNAGHIVHTPDLYLGEGVFDDYETAAAHLKSVGYGTVLARAAAAADELPTDVVYAGFSLGCAAAQQAAASRPGARAAVLMHGGQPLRSLAIENWPAEVPMQVHYAVNDPFRSQPRLDELLAAVRADGAACELFDYPVGGHLFADPDRADEYDAPSAALMLQRIVDFLP